jgi:hypothetical protein
MRDEDKTKEQLISELIELRQRITELEKSETDSKKDSKDDCALPVELSDVRVDLEGEAADLVFVKDITSCKQVEEEKERPETQFLHSLADLFRAMRELIEQSLMKPERQEFTNKNRIENRSIPTRQ